jgi:hypothetical protein
MKRAISQRDFMREMVKRYGADEDRIVRECAEAEKRGEVPGYLQSQFLLTKSLVEKPRVGMNTQLNRAVQGLCNSIHGILLIFKTSIYARSVSTRHLANTKQTRV